MAISRSAQLALAVVVAFTVGLSTGYLIPRPDGGGSRGTAAAPDPEDASPRDRPGPHNTGVPAGTQLSPSGPLSITEDGAVLDALDVTGRILIRADDVVIRRSRIHSDGDGFGIRVMEGSVTIEDTEIHGFEYGIVFGSYTARRVDIHSMGADGVILGSNSTLEDSYIHDLTPAPGAHADGAQLTNAGAENIVVRGNTIDLASPEVHSGYGGNSAIILKPDLGDLGSGGIVVEDNFLNGGNYTLYLTNDAQGRELAGVTIRNNRFGRVHRYGPRSVDTPCTCTNNVWDDTGDPVG